MKEYMPYQITLTAMSDFAGDWRKASSRADEIVRTFKAQCPPVGGSPRIFVCFAPETGEYVARENPDYAGCADWKRFAEYCKNIGLID